MKGKKANGNKSGKAVRYNTGKKQWGLVDFKSVEPMVEVLEFGAKKYAPNNWKKGLDKTQILESNNYFERINFQSPH